MRTKKKKKLFLVSCGNVIAPVLAHNCWEASQVFFAMTGLEQKTEVRLFGT